MQSISPPNRTTTLHRIAYLDQHNHLPSHPIGTQWFRIGESLKINEKYIASIILSGCACNYTVCDETKVVGYIINRIYFKVTY